VSVATRARKGRTDFVLDGQLDLFDAVADGPPPRGGDPQERRNGDVETCVAEIAHPSERARVGRHADADHAVLRALEEALSDASEAGDDGPALVVLASCLGVLGAPSTPLRAPGVSLRQAADEWLRRLETRAEEREHARRLPRRDRRPARVGGNDRARHRH
jgi:hypothetical protein